MRLGQRPRVGPLLPWAGPWIRRALRMCCPVLNVARSSADVIVFCRIHLLFVDFFVAISLGQLLLAQEVRVPTTHYPHNTAPPTVRSVGFCPDWSTTTSHFTAAMPAAAAALTWCCNTSWNNICYPSLQSCHPKRANISPEIYFCERGLPSIPQQQLCSLPVRQRPARR